MVKIVKFDPKLSTLKGGNMRVNRVESTTDHINRQGSGPLSQDHLDDIIRREAAPAAVETLACDTLTNQEYRLSNGRFLIISKRTGKGRIEMAFGTLVRRF